MVPTGMEEGGNNRRGHHDNSGILRSHRTVVVVVKLIVGALVVAQHSPYHIIGAGHHRVIACQTFSECFSLL